MRFESLQCHPGESYFATAPGLLATPGWRAPRVPSPRGIAEEAPGACKDVSTVVEVADAAGLARLAAKLEPLICIKG
jgi:hypothetical protein